MEDQIPVLLQVLNDAKDGDMKALKSLDVDFEESYNIRFRRKRVTVDKSQHDNMLGGLDDLVHIIEEAERLKMHVLCHICQQAFAYLSHLYTTKGRPVQFWRVKK